MPYKHDKSSKNWFSTLGVAQILDVSIRTVERWRSEGKLTPDKRTPGGHSRYSHEQVEKMEEQRKFEKMEEQRPLEIIEEPQANLASPFVLPSHEELVKYVDDFLEETGIKPSMFGREFLKDSGAIPRLREGTDPRLSTVRKICDAIEKTRKDQPLKKMLQEMME